MLISRSVRFGSFDRSSWEPIEAVIDTGSAFCQIPASVAQRLGAEAEFQQRLIQADGTWSDEDVCHLFLALGDSLPQIVTTIVIGPEYAPAIVGHIALEQLGVGLDPASGKLVPQLNYLLMQTGWPPL